jgi:hypothetical protein
MGLRELWNRLTSGDSLEREEEEIRDHPDEAPERVEDFEGMKDDRMIRQIYPGRERLPDDHL